MTLRFIRLPFAIRALCLAPLCFTAVSIGHAEDNLNPAVAKSLEAAGNSLSAHNYTQAMQDVTTADSVSGKSDYDSYVIEQMRGAIAAQSGDRAVMTSSYDKLIASSRTPRDTKAQLLQAEATVAYTAKDYPAAAAGFERYLKEIGPNADIEKYLIQAYYLQKDYANAARVQKKLVDETLKAKKLPSENELLMLASCQTQLKDTAGQMHTYTLLATYYPKPDYWEQLLHSLVTNNKLPPALQLDVYRIRLAAGNLKQPSDFIDAAEIATQMGLPRVGLDIMSQGYTLGVLGQGAGADRQVKLRNFISAAADKKQASLATDEATAAKAKTGDQLLFVGYNYVSFGQADKGLSLMKQAIEKGVADVGMARLRLGEAQMDAGQTANAIATFQTVEGDSAAHDIAQLWILKLKSASSK
ncbi:hypothetical protein AA0242T_1074 [Acetobacter aceti NRIC 0242]|uniref:Tetratricopeptide repeat-like domain-containing protein n=2 Tax=Acetobacter aceti TaxID=435 RepID=A0A6S6PLB3_ACEAC|nr:hypothetical protein [Acetobacter aceti]GBO80372.1 hypothetical protein AA0242T_1074 [Acetobacter aceti NRIC 0242]TCS33436.1 hypothetical protein EDC15_107118 [Acetobacter aceti NBRC 14818]BCI67810.1 hypothetical protein AAJCM20276_24340 [Acetobacter aceti]BCK77603.1 hypothetical protein EMQ_3209 [Acetobacter aceti NBRC 14818]GAN56758.1 hypothetical protein Abac_010_032 [Acetobacter aceti NBRC 14818]